MTPLSSRSSVRRFIAFTWFALTAWSVPGTALAQRTAPLDLRWDAPIGCPQLSEVRDRVSKLIGSASSTQGTLQAEGAITQADLGRFHLKLVMRSGGLVGERDIDSKSCDDLAGAAAVTLALLMRSDAPLSERDLVFSQTPNTTTGDATPASAAPGETDTRTKPDKPAPGNLEPRAKTPADDRSQPPSTPPVRRFRLLVQAPLAALSFGPLPRPSWGVAFAAGTSYENWRFLVQGSDWLQQNMPVSGFPGYGADIARSTATLRACRAQRFSAFEVAPCLVLSLEHISARGAGAHVTPRSEQATRLGVGGGVQGRLYLTRWFSLIVGADAQIEASRPRLSIDGVGDVGQLGAAAFAVTVGPEWIL